MIDIHTHILPGMDDGAADIYDSIEMAALAYENGTKVIVAIGITTAICRSIYDSAESFITGSRRSNILKRRRKAEC